MSRLLPNERQLLPYCIYDCSARCRVLRGIQHGSQHVGILIRHHVCWVAVLIRRLNACAATTRWWRRGRRWWKLCRSSRPGYRPTKPRSSAPLIAMGCWTCTTTIIPVRMAGNLVTCDPPLCCIGACSSQPSSMASSPVPCDRPLFAAAARLGFADVKRVLLHCNCLCV